VIVAVNKPQHDMYHDMYHSGTRHGCAINDWTKGDLDGACLALMQRLAVMQKHRKLIHH